MKALTTHHTTPTHHPHPSKDSDSSGSAMGRFRGGLPPTSLPPTCLRRPTYYRVVLRRKSADLPAYLTPYQESQPTYRLLSAQYTNFATEFSTHAWGQATDFDGHLAASRSAMPCPAPSMLDSAIQCAHMISAITVGAKCNSC